MVSVVPIVTIYVEKGGSMDEESENKVRRQVDWRSSTDKTSEHVGAMSVDVWSAKVRSNVDRARVGALLKEVIAE